MGVARDISGKNQTTQEIAKRLGQISTAPIFGVLDVALGEGIVGGSLVSFEQIGASGGGQVLDTIKGTPAAKNIPGILDVQPVPMFDWRQLHRWNLSVNDLPEGSTIINREYTLWDLKYYIIAAMAFILAQSCLLLMLLVQKRRRQSAEESLRQKTEELDRFFNVTLDLLCIANTRGYFQRLNPTWEKVLGYSREELMASRFFEFVHPDDLGKTREVVSRLASQMEVAHFENRYRCKDGSYRMMEWTAVLSGELIYAAARDLTERLEVEAEVRQRREELAHLARVATLGELTASLAHEVNQPLAAIMSNAQAAQRYLNAPAPDMAEIREILSDVAKEGSRASEVVNRLRSLLKKEKVEFEPLDLNSVFREVAMLLNGDALMRSVKVSLDLDPQLPLVQGDRIQLQQVALNLMLNSFDAMNECPSAERLAVITTCRHDSEVRAAVMDSGRGISNEESEKIFNPFFTTKPQGLGIGLSICRSIILRHQGKLWVESNPGQGATFNFSLPAVPDEKLLGNG